METSGRNSIGWRVNDLRTDGLFQWPQANFIKVIPESALSMKVVGAELASQKKVQGSTR